MPLILIYIYIYIYTHTHTYTYVYIYGKYSILTVKYSEPLSSVEYASNSLSHIYIYIYIHTQDKHTHSKVLRALEVS